MEDSFRVRVDKAFGSLAASSSSSTTAASSNLTSLWCLADDEIERTEWNRDKDNSEPETLTDSFLFKKEFFSGNRENSDVDFRLELEKDLDDLDDDFDDEQSGGSSSRSAKPKPDDYNDEEWEIKNSIGLDCTLDYEEEEDQYDKVAVGKEKAGDRLYMKEVTDYGIEVDSNNELPDSIRDIPRDPRANLIAAKIRLKEDAEAAIKMDSLRVSEQDLLAIADNQVKVSEDGNLKSILKRRDDDSDSKSRNNQLDSKSQKRVRFDPECKDDFDEESDGIRGTHMETDSVDESLVYPLPSDYPSGIPDYMRNPSKYTRYTFDSSSDVDEQSNRQAFMDFLKMLKKSNTTESQPDDAPFDLPKSLTFIPKRKALDTETVNNHSESKQNQDEASKESMLRRGLPICIAASDTEDGETCAMEEDEPETAAERKNSSQKSGRKYRTKATLEMDESI
ncbi:hypothetical protein P3X46_033711 [Hevea brasiliensis]|uniref:U5 small nuclear ribonucleoprotein TSSC4 n=1 Tax=Hevea brasiliensis TaxID=3981 RepID=A0ABQ9KC45_HEVBR|nr:uncharacterized protein LOC110638607 [Hevea brasiliensis]KAJ9132886.1 hypothetical protein P3X46_033711 [Hevea brasiliensis]